MPRLLFEVPDTDRTVLLPVVNDIMEDLKEMGALERHYRVLVVGEDMDLAQPGSTMEQAHRSGELNFGDDDIIVVEFTNGFVEELASNNTIGKIEHEPIFLDPGVSTYIQPDYSGHELRLSIRLRSQSETRVEQFRARMRNRILTGRYATVHKVSYGYRLPTVLYPILEEIHRLRERQFGYGSDYEQWMREHLHPRVTVATNLNGKYSEYMVRETLAQVQGWFDFDLEPEPSTRTEGGKAKEVSFGYTVRFDRVSTVTFAYPVVIHNQMLSSRYRESESPFELHHYLQRLSVSGAASRYFESTDVSWRHLLANGRGIPSFDDFTPLHTIPYTRRIYTALLAMPLPEDGGHILPPGTLIHNLHHITKPTLKADFIDYVISERHWCMRPYSSFVTFSLYRDREPMGSTRNTPLELDSEGNLYNTEPISLRNNTRIRLAVVTNPILVDEAAHDRIRENWKWGQIILDSIAPEYIDYKVQPLGNEPGYIPKRDWENMVFRRRGQNLGGTQVESYHLNTVSFFTIESHLKEQNYP